MLNACADKAVEIVAMDMATDLPSTFEENSCIKMVCGARVQMARRHLPGRLRHVQESSRCGVQGVRCCGTATRAPVTHAGVKPGDVDVVELHDCFSCNELITYEALSLCPIGHTPASNTVAHAAQARLVSSLTPATATTAAAW